MKKRIRILAIAIMMMLLLPQVACNCNGCNKEEYVVMGNFLCIIYDDCCDIMGLSEQGKQQEVIVIPEKVEGKKVISVGKQNFLGGIVGDWESEKLKTVYIPFCYDYFDIHCSFYQCENLEKAYLMYGDTSDLIFHHNCKIYNFFNTNIKFKFNCENEKDCFWIEIKESGEKIDKPLLDPEREGYTFDGWYKNEECTEKWNFETDIMIETEYIEEYDEYKTSLYLYAKWIEN